MSPFELSLSETLLLGFCREEYRTSSTSLFEVFERRLRSFVPLLTQTKFATVHPDMVPDDIKWYVLTEEGPLPEHSEESGSATKIRSRSRGLARPASPKYHFVQSDLPSFEDGNFYSGRSPTLPNVAFVRNECKERSRLPGCPENAISHGSILQISWDRSRRSLIELVIDAVHGACPSPCPELIDRRRIPSKERWLWDFAAFLDETWKGPSPPFNFQPLENEIPWWIVQDGSDHRVFGLSDRLDLCVLDAWEPQIILQAIDKIVSADETKVFETGSRFAALVRAGESLDDSFEPLEGLVCWLDPRADDAGSGREDFEDRLHASAGHCDNAHSEVLACLESVLKEECIPRCRHAESILKAELAKRQRLGSPGAFALTPLYWDGDTYDSVPWYASEGTEAHSDERYEYLARWSGAGAVAWLAFGDVLATLRETDRLARGADRPLPQLRAYQLHGDSSIDRVRAAVELAERELASETNPSQHPEVIVTCVAHGIEALAKRLWQNEFPTDRNAQRSLVAVLDQKKRFANELEQRFASVAMSLYTAYRNPAIHELDQFHCTWAEAQFFISGIRVLFDISERLVQSD